MTSLAGQDTSLTNYRSTDREKLRTDDLLNLITHTQDRGNTVVDIGARDGYFSQLFTNIFSSVTALDLEKPSISDQNIACVQGDITNLSCEDNSFDFVFCAEVLEHIPSHLLQQACLELSRICKKFMLIGVPYKQDLRVARTTCSNCFQENPPWGHVNSFDLDRLLNLFPELTASEISFVGKTKNRTNFLSAQLMNLAGNPYGTYTQDETCIHCGLNLGEPATRNFLQKISTKTATIITNLQLPLTTEHANWVHVLFRKEKSSLE